MANKRSPATNGGNMLLERVWAVPSARARMLFVIRVIRVGQNRADILQVLDVLGLSEYLEPAIEYLKELAS